MHGAPKFPAIISDLPLAPTEAEHNLVKSYSCKCDKLVNTMHITASVFMNDDESGLHHDYEHWLEELAPHEPVGRYHHNMTGKDKADAHYTQGIAS